LAQKTYRRREVPGTLYGKCRIEGGGDRERTLFLTRINATLSTFTFCGGQRKEKRLIGILEGASFSSAARVLKMTGLAHLDFQLAHVVPVGEGPAPVEVGLALVPSGGAISRQVHSGRWLWRL